MRRGHRLAEAGPQLAADPAEGSHTFSDFSGNAFGLDVLHGFEQQLSTESSSGHLVVADLLVRDDPLILRLER